MNKKTILQNCLFISDNLLTEKEHKIIFDTKCKIIVSKNDIILTMINNNKLYTFSIVKLNENVKYAYSSKVVDSMTSAKKSYKWKIIKRIKYFKIK